MGGTVWRVDAARTCVTGLKPTGTPHLGNYLGAVRPAIELARTHNCLVFIADYHALTTLHDPALLRRYTYDAAATCLAAGLNPATALLFRQSAVPEVFELAWVFECFITTAQLARGHAYKAAVAHGQTPNAGIFNYPALMAADIVLYGADVVAVGGDQKQHVEIARDAANRLNHLFGPVTVRVPEVLASGRAVVPGTDGRKMSKSHGNTIPLFATEPELRAAVMRIKTSSEPMRAPKDPASSIVFQLYESFAPAADIAAMKAGLETGRYGWREAKEALVAAIDAHVAPKREIFTSYRRDCGRLDDVLEQGAVRARAIATRTMERVRAATGIGAAPLMHAC